MHKQIQILKDVNISSMDPITSLLLQFFIIWSFLAKPPLVVSELWIIVTCDTRFVWRSVPFSQRGVFVIEPRTTRALVDWNRHQCETHNFRFSKIRGFLSFSKQLQFSKKNKWISDVVATLATNIIGSDFVWEFYVWLYWVIFQPD
jgi:hypothetical protein